MAKENFFVFIDESPEGIALTTISIQDYLWWYSDAITGR